MGLFNKKQQATVKPETTYDDVVDYLRDLAQQDYTKIIKVVGIYRNADKGVKKVLNIKPEPVGDGFTDKEIGEILFLDGPVETTTIKVSNAPKEKGKKK